MTSLRLTDITKKYAAATIVDHITLTIPPGHMHFLLGPSGCGKTTCLRMTAGFLTPDSGTIHFDDKDVTHLPPHRRNIGMVFQTYALFPHMTVENNIAYGLKLRKIPTTEKNRRVAEIIERVRLSGLAKRLPAQLSGGQQQRVALARALIIQPDILLLDEPLSNLDSRLRAEMRSEIKRIHDEFRITALYVTHDQEEALTLADTISLMRNGRIEQSGSPAQIYNHPVNQFVAQFIGDTNILTATPNDNTIDTPLGPIDTPPPPHRSSFPISIRPESIHIDQPHGTPATITSTTYLGNTIRLTLTLRDGTPITATHHATSTPPTPGATTLITMEPSHAAILQ